MKSLIAGIVLMLTAGISVAQVQSTALTDRIVQGVGEIDLLKDVTAAQLETYRLDNQSTLVFGVDINEAANGSEKRETQGVTVEDTYLQVVFAGGGTQTYQVYWTQTQAFVSPGASSDRASYYTLLGETGSSRITAANAVQEAFDSTLAVQVPDSLAGVSSAILVVRLLEVNSKLGDPEGFYDFTAGFEDLALLSAADTAYLDEVLPEAADFRRLATAMELSSAGEVTKVRVENAQGPSTGPDLQVVSTLYQPSNDEFYIVAYEDLYPIQGDYDFNDLMVAYRYQVNLNAAGQTVGMSGVAYLVAKGAEFSHDWSLELPLPSGAQITAGCNSVKADQSATACSINMVGQNLVWKAFDDTASIFPGALINTLEGRAFVAGPRSDFRVAFSTPIASPPTGHGNPVLYVRTTQQQIDLESRDERGYPFALIVPEEFASPLELVDIGIAYPLFIEFMKSNGARNPNWYLTPAANKIYPMNRSKWYW